MNANSLNKNVAYTTIAKAFSLAFSLIYSVLMLRLLGSEGNGVYSILVANAQAAFLFLGINTNGGIVYFIAGEKEKKEKILGLSVLIFLITSFLFLVGLLVSYTTGNTSIFMPKDYIGLFYVFVLVVLYFVRWTVSFSSSIALGNFLYRHFNRFILVSSLLRVVILFAFFLASRVNLIELNLERIFFILISMEFFFAFVYLIMIYIRIPFKLSFRFSYRGFVKQFFVYNLKGWILTLLKFFTNRFFNWVVNIHYSLALLGNLALSISLFTHIEQLVMSVNAALKPYLIKFEKEEGIKQFLFFFRLTNTLSFSISLFTFVFSPFFIPFIFGDDYLHAIYTTQIIFLAVPFLSIKNLGRMYAASQNKHQLMILPEVLAFVFAIIGDLIFIPSHGIKGAAWVLFGAYVISSIITAYILSRKMNVPIEKNLLVSREDVKKIWTEIKGRLTFRQ